MTEEELRSLLRELRDEPVPADSLVRMRQGLAQRVEARRMKWWWIPALLAPVCLALIAVWFAVPALTPVPTPAPLAVLNPTIPPTEAAPVMRSITRPKAAPRNNMTIRIETPDPEVVILLVADEPKGTGTL